MKPLDIATPALVRVRGEGRTFLALWRDKRLWDLNPLTLDALLRLPLDGIRAGLGPNLPSQPLRVRPRIRATAGLMPGAPLVRRD